MTKIAAELLAGGSCKLGIDDGSVDKGNEGVEQKTGGSIVSGGSARAEDDSGTKEIQCSGEEICSSSSSWATATTGGGEIPSSQHWLLLLLLLIMSGTGFSSTVVEGALEVVGNSGEVDSGGGGDRSPESTKWDGVVVNNGGAGGVGVGSTRLEW
jgi:hypothetical protein